MDIIPYGNRYFDSIISITVEIVGYLIIRRYFSQLHKLLTDKNSNIFIGILLYLYIIGIGVEFFISGDNKTTEVVTISLGLLLLQSIFAFVLYYAMIKTENNLLSKKEQENQKLQNQLLKAKNNELSQEKQRQKLQYELLKNEKDKLTEEHNQLKEYAEYLDKNEDDLRKFKHDYQNMMNSLIISAENGKTDEVVSKLKEYTNSHINSKALRKYKDLNHVHVDFLKSIAIAKLAKLYNADINYSFGCNKEINRIPKTIDYLDITRIIGIAFDNAYEESMALRKETGNLDSAQILATYYQEDGDFEFEIRNKIRPKKINTKLISRKNYTTKEHHMGIGLANVTEITKKYESTVLVNYGIDDDWFTFSLIVLPDEEE
ncbi:GHKL domain-containing protein [Lactobacillus sp. LL6]|uniref:GHKL domain-containing protein n=1 Tax=Lactobacillus sp. LL6 TaxID=2596827 RepID=UPI001186DFB2|nr:GHKL domain-containing protein [Lactobacillus sp. LL6]TSO26992.1 GHKL domain-containing protein [Lactobacillus sp. LL6]